MNTSIIVTIAVALSGPILTHSQTPAASKTPAESKLPIGITPKKVSPDKFESEYAWVGKPQTMHQVTYLGQRDERAYILRRSKSLLGGNWKDSVIYVELSELAPPFRNSLPKTAVNDAK